MVVKKGKKIKRVKYSSVWPLSCSNFLMDLSFHRWHCFNHVSTERQMSFKTDSKLKIYWLLCIYTLN